MPERKLKKMTTYLRQREKTYVRKLLVKMSTEKREIKKLKAESVRK